jgi:hypothetical protein
LRRSIESGDGRPTEQSYVVFRELTARLAMLQTELGKALRDDLAQFNKLLGEKRLEAIVR